jgi:arabinofuranosyltransferase
MAIMLGVALRRRTLTRRERVLIAAPLVGGLMLVVYVARVGGDFMHGRMLLAPTWLCVLPAMVIAVRRWTSLAVAALAGWALIVGISRRHLAWEDGDWYSDHDERLHYVAFTKDEHPLDPAVFYGGRPFVRTLDKALASNSAPILIWDANGSFTLLDPGINARIALLAGRLGTAAAAVPLDAIVIDMLGLANPLGARITVTFPGRIGHEKQIPAPWVLAEYGHPDTIASIPPDERREIMAARHAMQCGELAELLESVREPMTPSRFWKNLIGAWGRTRLVVPAMPTDAERRFCGGAEASEHP